jgi:hypothetical protein
MPISMMMPMSAMIVSSVLNSISVRSAPRPAAGKPDRMVIGWMKLSVKNAEDDVDYKDGQEHQHPLTFERFLELLGIALEAGSHRGWQAGLPLDLADAIDRLAKRYAALRSNALATLCTCCQSWSGQRVRWAALRLDDRTSRLHDGPAITPSRKRFGFWLAIPSMKTLWRQAGI